MAAGNAVVGALRVVLGADTAEFEDGLKSAALKLGLFAGVGAAAGKALADGVGNAFASISEVIPKTIEKFDAFAKQSQKIGIPVEQLSGLQHAANLSDVSMDQLGTSVAKLGRSMTDAAAKPLSDAGNAFRALGIAATNSDGSLKSTGDVMAEVADKFAGMNDGAGKTAVAMALFGRSGAELIPLLNSGASGLKDMTDEASQFGLVISGQTAKAAENFNDNLTRLAAAKQGIITQVTAHMLPALQALSQHFVDLAKNSNNVQTVSNALNSVFDALARAVVLVSDNIGGLLRIVGLFVGVNIATSVIQGAIAFAKFASAINLASIAMATFEAIRGISLKGILLIVGGLALVTGQFDQMTGALKDLGSKIESLLPEGISKQWNDVLDRLGVNTRALTMDLQKFGGATDETGKKLQTFNYSAMAGKTAFDSFLDSTRKSTAGLLAQTQTVGLSVGAAAALKVQLEGLAVAQANHINLTAQQNAQLSQLGADAGAAAAAFQGQQLVLEYTDPWTKYQTELANTTALMVAQGATADQLARMHQDLAQKAGFSWQNIAQNIAGTAGALSQLTGTWASENKTMGALSKAFGIAQAIINTQIGVTKAIATYGPTPWGFAAAALAVAQGAASIATISAQKFATGGEFVVGGGVSTTDNKLVPLNLASGERVRIEPNKYGEGSSGTGTGAGGVAYFSFTGQSYSREDARSMAEKIAEIVQDGYAPRFGAA